MKTLDEVIRALEYCQNSADDLGNCKEECPYIHNCNPECTAVKEDALQYLKAFRDAKNALAEISDNPLLTWEQLKSMKGKPVWIEYLGYTPNWEIVENIGAVRGSIGDFTGDFIETNKSVLHKNEQGKTWQAYRREIE